MRLRGDATKQLGSCGRHGLVACALLSVLAGVASPSAFSGSPPPRDQASIGPLSFDPDGADFTDWIGLFKDQLYQHWPPSAGVGLEGRGRVVVQFTVAREGKLERVRVKKSTGGKILEKAAQDALRASSIPPLPADYKHQRITMRLDFSLNERPTTLPTSRNPKQ